jgi:hypothetical protein
MLRVMHRAHVWVRVSAGMVAADGVLFPPRAMPLWQFMIKGITSGGFPR